jgi:hypothetical protein
MLISTAFILSAAVLAGCSSSITPYGEAPGQSDKSAVPLTEQGSGQATSSDAGPAAIERQVITNGYVTITVDEPLDAAAEATRITESAGGRVDARTESAPVDGTRGSATLEVRIPAEALTATLDKLKKLGNVQEVSLSSSDVTTVTQDLDARIRALSASVDRLLALLATATDTDTLIKLETAISDRQANLESLESERRYYADQTSLATVTLNLVSVTDAPADTFFTGVLTGWNAFVGFFAGLLVALGVLLPWLVLAAIAAAITIVLVRRRRKVT